MTIDQPLKPNALSALVAPNFTRSVPPVGGGVEVGGGTATVTVTDWLAEPPVPEQVSVYVVFAVRLPVLCEPDVGIVPDQPPDALHEDELVELHVSVEAVPEVIEFGLADSATVGPGVKELDACL